MASARRFITYGQPTDQGYHSFGAISRVESFQKDDYQKGGALMETLLTKVLDPIEINLMHALWTRGPLTARELCDALPLEQKRSESAVLAIMHQLAEKGVLRCEKVGSAPRTTNRYTARRSRADVLAAALAKLGDDLGAPHSDRRWVVQHTLAASVLR
jgi:predicted transcriptional regulator